MGTQTDQILVQAYEFLGNGDPAGAKPLLEDALAEDLENSEIMFAIRCVNYWIDLISRMETLSQPFERGEKLISHWKHFIQDIIANDDNVHERVLYEVRKGVFTLALGNYCCLLQDHHTLQKAEAYRKAGLCYKELGNYETALAHLGEANSLFEAVSRTSDSAAVLAEMADCYALCGHDNNAKVLFREAFFAGASKIELMFLESELIVRLIDLVKQKGFSEAAMLEWIPVYGVLYGVLNVKRQLRPQEVGRLKQSIYTLENEMKDPAAQPEILVPRLINHYFWLIDHYVTENNERSKINETLLKIQLLDNDVYNKYTM
ncbi:MAG: hypothetical protein J6B32_03920 [Spirochaetaceae bacterium]|nr:hypothetical protein [Spirochaetaceae bacterium]MBO5236242.1 hypothetical protein [Spirochaetaceae bacterium]